MMIRANCREKFTASDITFITEVLGKNRKQKNVLPRLLGDRHARDTILDDDALFRAILDKSSLGRFSPYLYFYLLTRKTFLASGIDDRDMSDYVANLLAEFSSTQRMHNPTEHHDVNYQYLVDMMADFIEASSTEAFYIRSHLGNYALFMTGIFPDNVYYKSTYGRTAPGFDYYEKMGSSSYYWAAQHQLAEKYRVSGILANLAEQFRRVRVALNKLADQYLTLDNRKKSLDKLLRQIFYGREDLPEFDA